MSDRQPPAEMGAFFDSVAPTYDEHMRESVDAFEAFYAAVAAAVLVADAG